ncbi:MAG TPA: PP2C family protein-serine/threonine phosphatase [Acidimicrobiales bacterium]|nr:PP2C family protein-serine/threonine phosphatase [Acidimicrobiales bacterium]
MSVVDTGACVFCGEVVVIGDDYCECCGKRLTPEPVAGRDANIEVDLGFAASVTNRGLVHHRNEDAIQLSGTDRRAVIVLSDGVTQSGVPHLASRAAVDAAGRLLTELVAAADGGAWDATGATIEAVRAGQDAVTAVPWPDTSDDSPACTFVSAVWDGRDITVCSLGDSRAYWFGATATTLLTRDDSVTDDEDDPRHHTITRWLGRDAPDGPPAVVSFRPDGAGRLLVCSDGLWGYASAIEVLDALVRTPEGRGPLDVARDLVEHALASGGRDNVTVAVVDISPDAEDVT